MGLIDGVMARKIHIGRDGKRYFAPFGPLGRVREIPDDAAYSRFVKRWRSFYFVGSVLGLSFPAFAPPGSVRLALFLIALVIAARAFSAWLSLGLPRAAITYAELPRRTWTELLRAEARATGRPLIGASLLGGVILTLIMVAAAIASPNDVRGWSGAALIGILTGYIYLSFRVAR